MARFLVGTVAELVQSCSDRGLGATAEHSRPRKSLDSGRSGRRGRWARLPGTQGKLRNCTTSDLLRFSRKPRNVCSIQGPCRICENITVLGETLKEREGGLKTICLGLMSEQWLTCRKKAPEHKYDVQTKQVTI